MVFDSLITIMSLCLIGVMGGLLHSLKAPGGGRACAVPLGAEKENGYEWYE